MLDYKSYELRKVKEDMDFIGETVTEFKTLLNLIENGELPNGLNEPYIKSQLRDIKRSMVNSWLILNLNEHDDQYWNLNETNKKEVDLVKVREIIYKVIGEYMIETKSIKELENEIMKRALNESDFIALYK